MLGIAARMAAKMAAKKMGKQAAKEADEIPRYTEAKSYKALEKTQKNSGPEGVLRDVEKGGAVALGSALVGASGKSSLENKETESSPKEASEEKSYKRGGKVSSASKRADGCCIKGKTKGRMV
jgi:hypothetical protein